LADAVAAVQFVMSLTLRNELVRDLFRDLQFHSNDDNRPEEGTEKEDYRLITSIGYSL